MFRLEHEGVTGTQRVKVACVGLMKGPTTLVGGKGRDVGL